MAIDQYAEAALGNREYFLNKPYGIGGAILLPAARKGLWVGGTLPLGYEMKDGSTGSRTLPSSRLKCAPPAQRSVL